MARPNREFLCGGTNSSNPLCSSGESVSRTGQTAAGRDHSHTVALVTPAIEANAFESGCDAYVAKPINIESLMRTVELFLPVSCACSGLSSIEPNRSGGEVDGGKEIPGGFVVAGCNRPELLEFAEEILDQVALFVEFSIEFARRQAVWSRRDYGGFASRCQRVEDSTIGIEGAICDQQASGHMRQ
jgi:CheY-like chemotaxis protein